MLTREICSFDQELKMRLLCEALRRAQDRVSSRIFAAPTPTNMDIILAARMARKLSELVAAGEDRLMPAVLVDRDYSIPMAEVRTDNFVGSGLARLGNHLY